MNLVDSFFKTLDGRKTVRKYSDYTPTGGEIGRIIESARLAPSATNSQNWQFVAIYNQDVKNQMAEAVEAAYDELGSRLENTGCEEMKEKAFRYKGHSTFFKNAPVVIAIVQMQSDYFMNNVLETAGYSADEIKLMRPDSQLLSIGGAIENMSLAAHALGLGSCWMAAPVIACHAFSRILNLSEGDKVVSLLTIGKPYEQNDRRSPKKTLEEVMRVIE